MNLYLSIAFTLFAIVAGMYLLAKTKAENLGRFYSIVAWLVIVVAGFSLLCQLGRGALQMACRTGICPSSENCMPGMYKKMMMGGCCTKSECYERDECCK